MKTVMERKERPYIQPSFVEKKPLIMDDFQQERSCFYDFGAKSPVGFSGFVDKGNSAFINEIGKGFDS